MGPSTLEPSSESPAERRGSRRVANDARRQSPDSVARSSARLESTSRAGRNAGAIASAEAQERPSRVALGRLRLASARHWRCRSREVGRVAGLTSARHRRWPLVRGRAGSRRGRGGWGGGLHEPGSHPWDATPPSAGKGARPRGGLGFVTPVGVTEPKPLCVSGDPIRLSLARVRILRGDLTLLSLTTHHHTITRRKFTLSGFRVLEETFCVFVLCTTELAR